MSIINIMNLLHPIYINSTNFHKIQNHLSNYSILIMNMNN